MASEKNPENFRNIDEQYFQALQRIFYFDKTDEDKSVSCFVDWCKEKGYGPVKARMIYEVLSGRSKPSPTLYNAFRDYIRDEAFQALMEVDGGVKASAAATLRTAADALIATASRLEGKR